MIKNKILLVFVFVLFFVSFRFSLAQVVINEVMYDLEGADTGREWVEIYNMSDDEVDLSLYKFFEANVNHGIVWKSGSKKIQSKGYAVIVSDIDKFKTDWPNYLGPVFDSSFSLNNEGEILIIKNYDLEIVDEYNYNTSIGANGDGKSLQRVLNSWHSATPTPGKENVPLSFVSTSNTTNQNTTNNTSTNTNANTNTSPTSTNIKNNFTLSLVVPNLGFVDMPIKFSAQALDSNNQKYIYGKYFWNFGDGNTKEIKGGLAESFSHTYFYPGEYNVGVFYYKNEYIDEPEIVKNFIVKVIPVSLLISNVGDEKDFFVEIENKSDSGVSLNGFSLRSVNSNFTFPKFSTIEKGKKIILSPKTTGFSFEDKKYLKLLDDNQKIIFDYGATINSEIVEVKSISSNPLRKINQNTINTSLTTNQESFIFENSNSENYDLLSVNLEANASSALEGENNNFYFVFLLIFIFFGALGIYFIRRNKKEFVAGDDFEILEE